MAARSGGADVLHGGAVRRLKQQSSLSCRAARYLRCLQQQSASGVNQAGAGQASPWISSILANVWLSELWLEPTV